MQISEGSGLSVTVRRGDVETIEQNKDKGISVTIYMGKQGAVRRARLKIWLMEYSGPANELRLRT